MNQGFAGERGLSDELVEGADNGYDFEQGEKVVIGRPSLNGSGIARLVQVRVDDGLDSQVRALAEEQERALSAVVRDALRQYVAKGS